MPLVLLHPIGLDVGTWFRMDFDGIPDVIRHNMLGHGGRPLPDKPLTLDAMADDVARSVSTPFDLVGFSIGGIVALHVAVRHPDKVRSLMVMCTASSEPAALEERAKQIEAQGLDGVVDGMLQRWFSDEAYDAPTDPAVDYARFTLLRNDPRLVAAVWRAGIVHDVRPQLADITCPVTVVGATGDWSGREKRAQELVTGLPVSRLCMIEGPHMLQLESGPECTALLHDHLQWSATATESAA